MKIARISLLIPILLLGTVLGPNVIHIANAATGEVCLADPTTANSTSPCPTPPPVFSGPVGQQIRIGVFIQASDALNGFDISLTANKTVLVPVGTDLAGTVLPGTPTIILECFQGVLIHGSVCPLTDDVTTLHFTVAAGLGLITTPPTTGLLFTAIYNITGTSPATGISVEFQTGCSGTSVTGGVCVAISNGSTNPDSETAQGGSFENSDSATMASVTLSASPTSFGPEFPGSSNSATVLATAVNGYASGFFSYADQVSFTIVATSGLTATLSGTNPCATGGVSCSVSLSLSATAAGNYTVTVYGTYATNDPSMNPDTLASLVSLDVSVDDFSFTITPTSTTFISGSTGVASLSLSGLNHFVGSIALSSGLVVPSGLTISYSPSTVTLSSGQTINSTATFSASPSSATLYHAIIKATSGSRIKNSPTLSLQVNIGHLTTTSLSCTPSSVNVNSPSTCTATVTDTNASPSIPTGTVSLTSNSTGVFTPSTSCILSAGATGTASCQIMYTPTALGTGSHAITGLYNGDSAHGASSGTFSLTVNPAVIIPDFTVTASPSNLIITQGGTVSSTIMIASVNGFTGTVNLVASSSPTGLNMTLTPIDIVLSSGGSGTSTLLMVTSPTTPAGTYTVTVTGTAASISHTVTITLIVNSSSSSGDFTITDSATFISIPTASERQTTVTLASINGFSAFVHLVARPSSTAFVCWFTTLTNASTIYIPAGGVANEYPTCTSGHLAGAYTLTIVGTSGSISHSVNVAVNVTDFSITGPQSISFNAGSSNTEAVTISSLSGFAGSIAISETSPLAISASCPTSVTLTSGGTSTVICSLASSTPGAYNVVFTGTFVCGDCYYNGKDINTLTTIVNVSGTGTPDFSIVANPTAVGANIGNNGTSIIAISPIDGFVGTVALTVPSLTGIFCSVNPMAILTKGSATLSCASSQPGTYGVTVTATSGTITHSVLITFTVLPQATSTGIVCIASADAATCPVVGPVIPGPLPNPGTQIRIAVLADSSQALDGFDITLLTNSTVLVPSGVQVGHVLANIHTIVECIGGVNKLGSTSCPTTDTVGTIEYGVVGELTTQPLTGVLFYAVFNVTSTSYASPMTFQTGCPNTSVSGGTCVSVSNGSTRLVPEAVQTARFSNLPYFDLAPSASTVVVFQGATDSSQFISVTSLNGFGGTTGGTVNLASSSSSNGAIVTLSPNSVAVSTNSDGLAGLTVTVPRTILPETYTLTITGTSGTLPSNSITISLVVIASDFLISTTSNALTINVGSNTTTTVNIVSGSGFTGTILLSANVSAPGLTTNLNPPTVTLTTTSVSASSTITIATSQTTSRGLYLVTLTGASGSIVHSVTIEIIVRSPIFAIGANPESLYLRVGDTGESSITAASIDGFNGTITLSTTVTPPVGLGVNLTTTTFYLSASSVCCSQYSLLLVTTTASTAPGLYLVTLTATNGTLTERVPISITVVLPPPPTFSISSNPAFQYVQAGLSTTSTITFSAMTGFAGTITVTSTVSPIVNTGTEPTVILSSNIVTLTSGGTQTLTLQFTTDRSTPPTQYLVTVLGRSGNLTVTATITVQVQPPPDIPPVANFTVFPSNPIVGQQITFDGSSSFDPDGTVVSWTWNLGNGFGSLTFNNPFFYTTYPLPGNYTVTLTVQDNAGLTGSRSMIVSVRPQPAHDVSIVSVNAQGEVVATQLVGISIQVRNDGTSNETVSITAYANGRAIQTLHNVFLQGCRINQFQNFCYYYNYEEIVWNTTGYAPGNYTISASISLPTGELDPTPEDNSLTGGIVSVFPAPVLTVTPNNGGVGAKVTVSGSGFFPPVPGYGFQGPLWVTFDDMFLGYNLNSQNGTFTFTFDVPQAQAGPHLVKAFNLYSGARASATFTVTPTAAGNLAVTINTGTLYFPGDKVVAYILTTLNGVPTGPSNVQLTVTLVFSNGTSRSMATAPISAGLYEAVYTVPTTGPLGTYAIVAKAHMTGPLDASSLSSFEVKLSWLSSNKNTIATVGTLAGLIGLVGVAWKKGYLRRKDEPARFLD